MSKAQKLSVEEEEKLIEFVKTHDILFNAKNKKFRDSEAKNRLWLQCAAEMELPGL